MSAPQTVAVIGAGIVGLSTAYALRQRGVDLVLYDAAPPGSGQSAGQSRIFRHAHDDGRLVEWVRRSRSLWRQWEQDWGVELISPDGAIAIGSGVEEKLQGLHRAGGVDARTVDAGELAQRLPLLTGYSGVAMLDAHGGAIRTRTAISALTERLSGTLVTDHVLTVRRTNSATVEVRTGTRRDEYDHVLICAGRGTAALARGVGLELPVDLAAHVRVSFAVRGATPARLATFQDSSGDFGETGVYAAPYPGNKFYSVGLSETVQVYDDGSVANPTALADLAERTVAYTERALPGLDPAPVEYVHCWVTRLPWGEDGVGLWSEDGISAVAGHNLFKQAPVLGKVLASVAVGEGMPADFRPEAQLGRDG